MAKLINQEEAERYRGGILNEDVRAIIDHATVLVMSSDDVPKQDFDLLFYTKLIEELILSLELQNVVKASSDSDDFI
jgi:hypothetical protein